MPKYKIGVFGSAGSLGLDKNIKRFKKLAGMIGSGLAARNCILITGASSGLPYFAALAASQAGGVTWGFGAALDRKILNETTLGCNNIVYSKLIYVPKNLNYITNIEIARKFRNVTSTAYCDAGIIISGMWGTMNEFTNLYDMGKVIGILSGTGGVADELPRLLRKIRKPSKAKVIFNKSPKKLVELVLKELSKRK